MEKQATRSIDVKETAKLIRQTLKEAFPRTKFSVRLERYAGGCSIDARWVDGPNGKQVTEILDRFNGEGFDGMIDLAYYCGQRIYKGETVDFHSGYVKGQRTYSVETLRTVAEVIASDAGVPVPTIEDSGFGARVKDAHDVHVPFQWHDHWMSDRTLTLEALMSDRGHFLASDPTQGEYLTRLIDRVASALSLEDTCPVDLPQYIRSYAIEVIADSSGQWCGNGLRFETEKQANEYASDLFTRWTAVREYRTVPSTDEVNRPLTECEVLS